MKFVKNYWWPDHDNSQSPVKQVKDIEIALKYVEKFDCAIQAGGNVGVWPNYLAERFKEVITFEPIRENFECLEINKRDNVTAYNYALSNVKERIGFYVLDGFHHTSIANYVNPKGSDYETATIDDYDLSPNLIYLDINGYEYFALKGAERTICKHNPVIAFEKNPLAINYGAFDIELYLAQFGYKTVDKINRDVICTNR